MKNLIIFILLVLFSFTILHSYNIEETLQQIESLSKEIKQNETLVEKKIIAELKQNNPLFAERNAFESDIEYLIRMSKAMPRIQQIRKEHLEESWKKISLLRGRLFETKEIKIEIDPKNYDPNEEKWEIVVTHLGYQKERISITLDITKNDAGSLNKNWDKVIKTGILSIDIGDKIGLAKLHLENKITGFNREYEFQPMKTLYHENTVTSVTFSPDGKFLATGSDYVVRIFNLETGKEIKSLMGKEITNFTGEYYINFVKFSTDGKLLVTRHDDSTARIFNVETGNEMKSFYGFSSIALSPDGKFLATNKWGGETISIVNWETGRIVKSINDDNYIYSITFSPYGKFLAIGDFNSARIFNVETGNEVKSFKHGGQVNSIAFSPDGKLLGTGSEDYKARIFNLETGNVIKSFSHRNQSLTSVAFSPDGKFFATGNFVFVRIFNVETGKEVKSFKNHGRVNSVTFSPDGKYIAVGSDKVYIHRTLF